jgi:hypothetical protein
MKCGHAHAHQAVKEYLSSNKYIRLSKRRIPISTATVGLFERIKGVYAIIADLYIQINYLDL